MLPLACSRARSRAVQQASGRTFPVISFVYLPVECPFYKFYRINCRPKSDAKLLDRFFHRRRQVSPVVKYLTHCFFDGYYHLLDGDLAVSLYRGLASILTRFVHSSFYWHDRRSTLVLDQQHQEFCWIATACIPVNDMNIVRTFIEGLSWRQCYLLSTLQLHHNGALQHVNKRLCIVSVDRVRPAWRMLYCDHQNFPAGILRKIFRHERRDLRLLSHRWAAHEA